MITIDELLNMMSAFIEIGEGKDHKVPDIHVLFSDVATMYKSVSYKVVF